MSNEYEQELYDCCRQSRTSAVLSFIACPCMFGELYARRRSEGKCLAHWIVGTLMSFVPLINCFFYAKERQGVQADGRIPVQEMRYIFCTSCCLFGCYLAQDRAQYMKDMGEPRLIGFPK